MINAPGEVVGIGEAAPDQRTHERHAEKQFRQVVRGDGVLGQFAPFDSSVDVVVVLTSVASADVGDIGIDFQ